MKEKALKYKKIRIFMAGMLIMLGFAAVVGRLYFIQVIEHERYSNYSKNQYFQKVTFNQRRGRILDRNMTPLAITVPMKSVFASPYRVDDKEHVVRALSEELGMDRKLLLEKLDRKKNFVWVKRKITAGEYQSLNKRDLQGVSFLTEDKRFYPQNILASRVIGFCGIDNQGLAGLEYLYDGTLLGGKTVYIARKDALGRTYGFANDREPGEKFEMVLTLDANIQYLAEKAIRKAYVEYQAKSATAIVMAVRTGEILAIAEQPDFDPNYFRNYPQDRFKSLSVTESYEPGSTFKIFLAAAAMDSGLVTPGEEFDCGDKGYIEIFGRRISEAMGKGYGKLRFSEIISKSSNIGSILVGQRLGAERFYGYIKKFGFGEKTGVDIPGEATGIVRNYKEWSALSLPSISFGQEITATPIQLAAALSSIGNGGVYVRPHLMRRVMRDGEVIREFPNQVSDRVVSEEAARRVVEMMRLAVVEGTGGNAMIKGYDIAGKTGTAQKFDQELNAYSSDRYLASFMALYPANDPLFSIVVMVDEPKGAMWGGTVAAPVAKEIVVGTARYLGIPSMAETRYEVDWRDMRKNFLPKAPQVEPRKKNWMEELFAERIVKPLEQIL